MGRRQFDLEFKHTIVELLLSGKTIKEICLEYSLGESMVSRWRREYSTASGSLKSKEAITEEQLELKTLRKELREVKMERDILKKAVSSTAPPGSELSLCPPRATSKIPVYS